MRSKNAQTHLERAREQAVKERRDAKGAKKLDQALAGSEGSRDADGAADATPALSGSEVAALDREAWNTP